jgi:ribosome modulation factor
MRIALEIIGLAWAVALLSVAALVYLILTPPPPRRWQPPTAQYDKTPFELGETAGFFDIGKDQCPYIANDARHEWFRGYYAGQQRAAILLADKHISSTK